MNHVEIEQKTFHTDGKPKVAILLVGYGEVEDYAHFADYNESALRLLTAKFVTIPDSLFFWVAKVLSFLDKREWHSHGDFVSPHNRIFEGQRAGIEASLQRRFGEQVKVFKSFNFCKPYLPEQVLQQIRSEGYERVILYPLLVVDSVFTSGLALQQFNEALSHQDRWIKAMRYWPSFFDAKDYHKLLAESFHESIQQAQGPYPSSQVGVILMNHGCPIDARGFTTGVDESVALYESVRSEMITRYPLISIGWLNHDTPGKWTTPDVTQAAKNLLHLGAKKLVFAPIGFCTENHETILDVAHILEKFDKEGVPCQHLPCVNEDEKFCEMAAQWIEPLVGELLNVSELAEQSPVHNGHSHAEHSHGHSHNGHAHNGHAHPHPPQKQAHSHGDGHTHVH